MKMTRRHRRKCSAYGQRGQTEKKNCTCPIQVAGTLNGQTIRKGMKETNWKAAKAIVDGWEKAGRIDTYVLAPRTVAAAVADFIGSKQRVKRIRPNTLEMYTSLLTRRFVEFCGDTPLHRVTFEMVKRFRDDWTDQLHIGPGTQVEMQKKLVAFFQYCHEQEFIAANPTIKLDKFGDIESREVLPFTPEEIERIVVACGRLPIKQHERAHRDDHLDRRARALAFVLLMRYTGLRIGDVAMLTWADIMDRQYLDREIIKTRAGKKRRARMPLPDRVSAALYAVPAERLGHHSRYVFWDGHVVYKSATAKWWKELGYIFELANVPDGHSHRFRHTFAVTALQEGRSLETVSRWLTHSSITVTEKYYNAFIPARQARLDDEMRAMPGFHDLPTPPAQDSPSVDAPAPPPTQG